MYIVGRYERVRLLSPQGMGAPLVLDKKHRRLTPYQRPDWEPIPDSGLIVPSVRGGIGLTSSAQQPRVWLGQSLVDLTPLTRALSNAYAYGSTGNALGGRYRLHEAKTLNRLYFFLSSYTGTAANVNDILVELRDDSGSNTPGTTLHASESKDPASATGWITCSSLTPSTFAMSADTTYWSSVADPDGNGTDFASCLRLGGGLYEPDYFTAQGAQCSANNGWATTALAAQATTVILGFSDSTGLGSPYSASAASTSSTNRRGLLLAGLRAPLKILGITSLLASANLSGIEVYQGTALPGSTPYATGAVEGYVGAGSTIGGYLFATPPTLEAQTQYRVVFTYSSAATAPRKLSIGTGADSVLRSCMLGGGAWYWTEANGTTDWSNDDISAWPQVALIIEDQVSRPVGDGTGMFRHVTYRG